jgi:hypothetical protein
LSLFISGIISPGLAPAEKAGADPASLQNLNDIVVPPPVPWWPPAFGWYVLGLVLILIIAWLVWRGLRRRQAEAYRRAALAELAGLSRRISQPEKSREALAELPELLKRTALAAWPREEIASLSGERWLDFLDRTGGTDKFKQGPGRLLLQISYTPYQELTDLGPEQIDGLTRTLRDWIVKHQTPKTGGSG